MSDTNIDGDKIIIHTGGDVTITLAKVLLDVVGERQRQDKKWGEQNWDPQTYMCILMEEVGEAATEANDARFLFRGEEGRKAALARFRTEMVQSAAVALAIVECLDRGKWKWPTP